MNINLLLDNVVRQTMVLIAQLATLSGSRANLDSVASRVFLELVAELKSQGLGNKVIADMFGLALRTYHDRVRRLSESATDRGHSLWSAVLRYVREQRLVSRAALLRRFHADEEPSVRGVLRDLVDSGLLFKSGRGDTTTYRAADESELDATLPSTNAASSDALWIWVILHQAGPTTREDLKQRTGLSEEQLTAGINSLIAGRQLRRDGEHYLSDECIIPFGAEQGWEAALFDHYQAVLTTMANKLSQGKRRALPNEALGGSTYHFDLFRGHPLEEDVLGFLSKVRREATELRKRVDAEPRPSQPLEYRCVFYAGQNVIVSGEALAADETEIEE